MMSHFYLPELFLLLWAIVESCAPHQMPCIPYALSCDDVYDELKNHQSVHVMVEHESVDIVHELRAVSTLLEGNLCSVVLPNSSNWDTDTLFTLKIYDVRDGVSDPLYERNGIKLDCVKRMATSSSPNVNFPVDNRPTTERPMRGVNNRRSDANRSLLNKFLILLPVFLRIFF